MRYGAVHLIWLISFLITGLAWMSCAGRILGNIVNLQLRPQLTSCSTPLQVACYNGYLDIARLLMNRGAYVNYVNALGYTSIYYLWSPVASFPRTDFIKAMLAITDLTITSSREDGLTALITAALYGSAEDITLLEKLGTTFYEPDYWGQNIMHDCCWGSNLETFDYFAPRMVRGWVHETDCYGCTPLHCLFEYRGGDHRDYYRRHQPELAERLIRAGVDVHARDNDGCSAFDIAKKTDIKYKKLKCAEDDSWRQNVAAYVRALRACDYDVQIDEEGDLLWLAEP